MANVTITIDVWPVALLILTEKQYRVLELREKHGLSWRLIGTMTNTDQTTVRGHYHAGCKRLSDHYTEGST